MGPTAIATTTLSIPARRNEPLAPRTTFGIGGPSRLFIEPRTGSELHAALAEARRGGIPWFILGGGSNLLVPDAGYPGLTIHLGRMSRVRVEGDRIVAEAGAPLSAVLCAALRAGLSGLEPLAGIPGTVGGAVAMNAGTRSGETFDTIEWVTLVSPSGRCERVPAGRVPHAYRRAELSGRIVLDATFRLRPDDPAAIRDRITENLVLKRQAQPLAAKSAGCIFKNPPNDAAGRLIDRAGLKGLRVGDAEVSRVHANFIVNRANARAADVLYLIRRIQHEVRIASGVSLELEVKLPSLRADA